MLIYILIYVDVSNPENSVLFVQKGKTTTEFPVNKNIVTINGKEIELDSVTVQTNGNFYVSKEAVQLVKKINKKRTVRVVFSISLQM
ncbi:copper amine oxidase N-terminal domain-containing protein [Metabacillus idriensis]|uniref:Copper amine oxidase-like N-terminal domain-containing protein n=1 Tax=Metabacillus idriensis TaxID=324768 RepID=A0A6I2MEQ1_9BACI|nr:stalk domain-containing protein [Metabacillus idriensis]MCM3598034.1 copper amine oxidase N-terminal domain-containing protein [Metabacillus idriensis]MRX56858.1 hypothetical protein [Metabacillus idriensis]